MKVEKILYQRIFPLSAYVNEKIGVEMIVEKGDDAYDVLDLAKSIVEDWHKQHHPVPYDPSLTPEEQLPVIQLQDERSKEMVDRIAEAMSITELAALKADLPPELMPAYMDRLKYLTPKTVQF